MNINYDNLMFIEDPSRYSCPPDPDSKQRHEEEYDGDAIEPDEPDFSMDELDWQESYPDLAENSHDDANSKVSDRPS